MMHRNRSVDVHRFAMVPRAEIPRASFSIQFTHKTTFDCGFLIPIYVDEVLPGDSFNVKMTGFGRLSTPLFPVMDNLYLESFFFFVPNRLVWDNWAKFMGEQDSPGDSISYLVPQSNPPVGGYAKLTIFDYFGLPTAGQVAAGQAYTHSVLPLRCYNLIFNKWFRDENLVPQIAENRSDGPEGYTNFALQRRGKRHDYFTSCLPWPQKGGTSVSIPLGTSAPVVADTAVGPGGIPSFKAQGAGLATSLFQNSTTTVAWNPAATATGYASWFQTALKADLSAATAATINQLRQSFQIQKLLERDARGGTRYTEIVRAHFGVISPDARLQRPEYLGGGSTPLIVNPIAQTSATGVTGSTAPLGSLGAMGTTVVHGHGFRQSFTEHGHVIGLVSVRADLTYQQGLRKMWSRSTRYDFYFPAFAMLGEQAVLNKEIFCDGTANDALVFGYQERWAEYRYHPSQITGLFRSTSAGTIDGWHLAQRFAALPTLGKTFIEETPPVSRVLAVGAAADGQQIIFDSFFDVRAARPMPLYSVPGLIDHF